ncbi:adenosylcobinamide-GDP ribazoletransferase [Pandoraea pnomenusa]|uniref:adenosylcobinamide-GDP ribazoletransferase n=1 Tax=Pandoraea pnomenusa TaxID=93220 RepID=UPI0011464BED|nr:adenosylcobinamide-GDP ribazoletransferase [Pandoraea pnomenusa]QDH58877.1 adenosylcobinamide-GDP ribazoletransferase [Pandoraea pnomenusa]
MTPLPSDPRHDHEHDHEHGRCSDDGAPPPALTAAAASPHVDVPGSGEVSFGGLKGQCRLFLTALGFFTRLPIPRWVGYSPEQLNAATRYFPLVGVFVGALVAGLTVAMGALWSPHLAIALGLAVSVLLTGAFHEDGLADAVDAFGGAFTRERALDIMHDSRIGTYGAVALWLALAIKWQALVDIQAAAGWGGFAVVSIGAHAASRSMAISLLRSLDYVRAQGKAKPIAQRLSLGALTFGVLCSAPWWIWPDWRAGVSGAAVLVVVRAGLVRYLRRRLGGYTGDTLGFAQQLGELALYLTVCAWI